VKARFDPSALPPAPVVDTADADPTIGVPMTGTTRLAATATHRRVPRSMR
jgi:hypothetical protein